MLIFEVFMSILFPVFICHGYGGKWDNDIKNYPIDLDVEIKGTNLILSFNLETNGISF